MAVITISNELGTGGTEIGQLVAQTLGYQFVDKGTSDGIFCQYGLTKFNQLYNSAPSFLDLLNSDNLLIVSMLNEILEALAHRGNIVISGRAGFAVLGNYADVLNVHIKAPLADRVKRLMALEDLSDPQVAEERLLEDDNIHRRFVQQFYNRQWDEPSGFGLIINVGALSSETIVRQIVDVAHSLEQKSFNADAITTARIKVDPVLADAINKEMSSPPGPGKHD